jgi:hypothetical protein
MKIVMLNSKDSEEGLSIYNKKLLEQIQKICKVSMYTKIADDFSNIEELTDDEEKLIKRWIKPEMESVYSFLNQHNLFYNLNKIEKSFNQKLDIVYD